LKAADCSPRLTDREAAQCIAKGKSICEPATYLRRKLYHGLAVRPIHSYAYLLQLVTLLFISASKTTNETEPKRTQRLGQAKGPSACRRKGLSKAEESLGFQLLGAGAPVVGFT
jgi:hypothetical protein